MKKKAFQDYYPDELSHCYGCGRLNEQGLHLKSHWDGDESVAMFEPRRYHMALPGFVYGGLIASLIDCHGTGTASAVAYREAGRGMDTLPPLRFVTAALKVNFFKPTPMGPRLEVRGKPTEIKERKIVVHVTVSGKNQVCAEGEVVAVRMPENMMPNPSK